LLLYPEICRERDDGMTLSGLTRPARVIHDRCRNDTLRYIRCAAHPHHAAKAYPCSVFRRVQSLSWHTLARRHLKLVQTRCALLLTPLPVLVTQSRLKQLLVSAATATGREAIISCRRNKVVERSYLSHGLGCWCGPRGG
jgi:hypothetical protein